MCALADELSGARTEALLEARQWHPVGRWAAELFDVQRGQDAQLKKEKLGSKSCEEVVDGADRTNTRANITSSLIMVALAAVLGKIWYCGPSARRKSKRNSKDGKKNM
jgi:hypothetical protein